MNDSKVVASVTPLLIQRVRDGNPAAEEELVHLYAPRVERWVAYQLRHCDGVLEVVDDVLLALLRGLREGKLRDPDCFNSYVFGTVHNVVNNHLRRARRQPRLEPLTDAVASSDPITGYEAAERLRICRAALKRLAPTDRHILFLALVEGLKSSEIATRLGLSKEVVRQRKSRAQRKLGEMIRAQVLEKPQRLDSTLV